jgi:hypothetical protein
MEDDEAALRRLWASVIVQALIDATSDPKTSEGRVNRDRARAWLTVEVGTTAQDFEAVCLAAGIEPWRVRHFYNNYDGQPLNLHVLARMRNAALQNTDAKEEPT